MLIDEKDLDRNQAFAARYSKNTPVMVIGDAGTGKTTVAAHRLRWLLENGVDPDEILVLVPRKQTGTGERLANLLRDVPGLTDTALEVREVHELCRSLVSKHLDDVDRLMFWDRDTDRIEVVYNDPDDEDEVDDEEVGCSVRRKVQMIGERTRRQIIDSVIKGFSDLESADSLARLRLYEKIRRLKCNLLTPEDVRNDENFWQYYHYEKVLKNNLLLDAEDVYIAVCRLFESKADLRQAFRERYRYVVVLDYQELTRAEQTALRAMFGRRHHLMLIGNKNQAQNEVRYGFPEGLDLFTLDYDDGEVIRLSEVYRPVPKVEYIRAEEELDELRLLEDLVDQLHDEGYQKHEIAVFCHTADELRVYSRRLPNASVCHLWNAKGREFRVVILPGMDEEHITRTYVTNLERRGKVGLGARSTYRMIYQGITRATERVYLSWVSKRTYGDMTVVSQLSRVLDTVEDDIQSRARVNHVPKVAQASGSGTDPKDNGMSDRGRTKKEKAETAITKCL
ncbi:MAG: UvrD-helicase domain-containing protein [Firmicutes bacterium]|nr:UvrD-helicase domain-containing protein [Bacillota bacterium]